MSEREVPHHQHISSVSNEGGSQGFVGSARDVYFAVPHESQEASERAAAKACRNALCLTDPIIDRENLISAKGRRVAGTCEWITQNESYRAWLNSDDNVRGNNNSTRLLWISGGPGKGKTMMSVFLTEELKRHITPTEGTELAFLFCSAEDEKRNTAVAVLRGLVHQIIVKRPQLVKHALPYFETPERTQQTLSSLETLWVIFSKLVADAELGTMFCVLDGLDECEESTLGALLSRIVSLLSGDTLTLTRDTFKLVIVSRDIPDLQGCTRIRLDPDNDERVASDIELFVAARVQELSRIRGFNDEFGGYVEKTLLARAEGTFLWVGFAMHELLRKQTCTEIQKALDGLPAGLPAIYSRMLLRIPVEQKATSCAILRWVTMAQRPLKLLELAAAVGIGAPHPLICTDQAVRDAIEYCKPLVEIQRDEVRLVHQSVRDYILQKDSGADALPELFRVTPDEAHSGIAQTCLDCIARSSFKCRPLTWKEIRCPQESALLAYATCHWPEHARSCRRLDTVLLSNLERFLTSTHLARRHWWAAYRRENCIHLPEVLPLLHMLCYLGFGMLVQRTLAWDWWRPRSLKRVESRNVEGRTALHMVACEGQEAMVRLLVDLGADIESKSNDGKTALHMVACEGQEAMVRLLVDLGADIESKSDDGNTVLQSTVSVPDISSREKVQVIQLLVDMGANIEAKGNHGKTALHYAVRTMIQPLVQLLLERGANVEAEDEAGYTTLILAAEIAPEEIVQLLVIHGANVNAKNKNGWTALHWAIMRRFDAATRLLIDKGADLEATTNNGWTVLHSAVGRKNKALVQLLKARLAS